MNKKFIQKTGSKRGSSLMELIIVTALFIIFIPIALGIYIGGRKISGQSYLQHGAAATLGETSDILTFIRSQDFNLMENGSFYLIRNPGGNSWLVKNDLPDREAYERYVVISNALRHPDTDDLYLEGDIGPNYEDPETKKIEITILWAPDYIPLDLLSQTFYISNWEGNYSF